MQKLMALILVWLAVFAGMATSAFAQQNSAIEPGSLGLGSLALRSGFNASLDAPTGVVATEGVLGFGWIDATLGIGWAPECCVIDDAAVVMPSVGVQALVHEWGEGDVRQSLRMTLQFDANDAFDALAEDDELYQRCIELTRSCDELADDLCLVFPLYTEAGREAAARCLDACEGTAACLMDPDAT